MAKVRWNNGEDLTLAATILNEVGRGKSTNEAFKIASKQLSANGVERTVDSISFRWNSVLKKDYKKAFENAKKEGSKHKQKLHIGKSVRVDNKDEVEEFISSTLTNSVESLPIEKVINTENKLNTQDSYSDIKSALGGLSNLQQFIDGYVEELSSSYELMKAEKEELEAQNARLISENESLKEDYNAVLSIIDKARKLTITQENDLPEKSQGNKFKMDRNGDLTRI